MYMHIHIYRKQQLMKKGSINFQKNKEGIGEGLKGGKGTEKWYNYKARNKRKNKIGDPEIPWYLKELEPILLVCPSLLGSLPGSGSLVYLTFPQVFTYLGGLLLEHSMFVIHMPTWYLPSLYWVPGFCITYSLWLWPLFSFFSFGMISLHIPGLSGTS